MTSLVQSVDWLALGPALVTALAGLIALVADLFLNGRNHRVLGWFSVAALVLAGLALIPLLDGDRATFCLTEGTRTCAYVADTFTVVVQLLVIGGALLTALLSLGTVDEAELPGEYWFLLLSSAAGAALLPASRDLATLVVALEVASLPAFALVGLRGRGTPRRAGGATATGATEGPDGGAGTDRAGRMSAEAALKFFLSSVTATAVTLLGVSFVYASTGSLHLTVVADRLDHVDGQLVTLAQVGAVLTLVGFAFKLAAVPFHFWVPDTYVGAPLPVAAYLSVVGKSAGFSGLILLIVIAFRPYADVWGPALAVLAALTMTAGNVAALRQRGDRPRSAVRLLAWSSVAQAGYLLVPLAAAGRHDDPLRTVGATIAYALMYTVVNLGAFAVAALVGRVSAGNRIIDYRGLFARNRFAALALAFFLLCLAGLPPGIIGLFAKVTVFSAAVDAGLGWLAVLMAVNVVIALYYYLRWTAVLFTAPEPLAGGPSPRVPAARTTMGAVPVTAAQGVGQPASGPAPSRAVPPSELATAPGPAAASPGPATSGPAMDQVPRPLGATIALTLVISVILSGAPELVLRFASNALF